MGNMAKSSPAEIFKFYLIYVLFLLHIILFLFLLSFIYKYIVHTQQNETQIFDFPVQFSINGTDA